MRRQRLILIVLIIVAALQAMYYYPLLPRTVASHFDGAGHPNGYSSKEEFIVIYLLVMLAMSFLFFLFSFPMKYLPDAFINLPKKDYWLAPARRKETLLFLAEKMLVFGNATILFLIVTFQLAFEANLGGHFSSGTMMLLLGCYLFFTAIWLIRLIVRFYKTDGSLKD